MFDYFRSIFGRSPMPLVGSSSQTGSLTDTQNQKTEPVYNGNCPANLKDKVVFAFKSGDTNYFMFSAELNMPFSRFMAALDIYDELEQGLNPGVIMKFISALKSQIIDPKNKTKEALIAKLAIPISMIEEAQNIHHSHTIHMKLATVRYFDGTEDVTGYDHDYNLRKMEHWMKHHDIEDFFFMLPVQNFLPLPTSFQGNLDKYLEGTIVQMEKTMEVLLALDTQENKNPELETYLLQQGEIFRKLKDWRRYRSESIALSEPS